MRRESCVGRSIRHLICMGFLLLASTGCVTFGQNLASALGKARATHGNTPHDSNTPRDEAEALSWIQESLKSSTGKMTNIKMENHTITAQCSGCTSGANFQIDLAWVSSIEKPSEPSGGNLQAVVHWYEFPSPSSNPGTVVWQKSVWSLISALPAANMYYAALSYLVDSAQAAEDTVAANMLADFNPKAAAWRQMKVKPAMPTEAHEHQVLAEYAYKNKDIPKAILEYEAALNIFPYWPDGQSNLANLAAEVGTRPGYRIAVDHMQMYLDLVPDAPDAQAAQDSIIIWKSKLGEIH